MKTRKKNWIAVAAVSALFFAACNKDNSIQTSDSSTLTEASAIAVPATVSGAVEDVTGDSIYIVGSCARHEDRTPLDSASLPSTVLTYLKENYAGYVFHEAFSVADSSGNLRGYIAIVYYNDKPVGIRFSATGAFEKVLEQRDKGDFGPDGHHRGGRFEHRDGMHRDSIALANLPSAVTEYMAANYSTDTLLKAFKNADSSILVISANNGLYATLFNSSGSFTSRAMLPARDGEHAPITEDALPATITYYLDTAYPNYVFEKAFSISVDGNIKGFLVVIDANNTKYGVAFDAAGNFIGSKPIH